MNKSIFRNDKVILTKEYEEMKQVGETFEVANVTENVVVLREVTSKVAVGAIKIEDFDEYFEKVDNLKGFTPWTALYDPKQNVVAFYRTNHKKVQVRIPIQLTDKEYIQAEASCDKYDEFDLFFGIQLAYARAVNKYFEKAIIPIYKSNKNRIVNLINSKQKD